MKRIPGSLDESEEWPPESEEELLRLASTEELATLKKRNLKVRFRLVDVPSDSISKQEFEILDFYLSDAGQSLLEAGIKTSIKNQQPDQRQLQPNPVLIRALLPPELAEDIIANLEHYYQSVWRKRHSGWAAKAIFYAQNVRAILGHYAGVIRSTLELYLKRS